MGLSFSQICIILPVGVVIFIVLLFSIILLFSYKKSDDFIFYVSLYCGDKSGNKIIYFFIGAQLFFISFFLFLKNLFKQVDNKKSNIGDTADEKQEMEEGKAGGLGVDVSNFKNFAEDTNARKCFFLISMALIAAFIAVTFGGSEKLIAKGFFSNTALKIEKRIRAHTGIDYSSIDEEKAYEKYLAEKKGENLAEKRAEALVTIEWIKHFSFVNKLSIFIYTFLFLCMVASLIPMSSNIMGFRLKIFFYNFTFFFLLLWLWDYLSFFVKDINPYYVLPLLPYSAVMGLLNMPEPVQAIVFVLNVYAIYWLLSKIVPGVIAVKKLPCPNCGDYMDVKFNWVCRRCHEPQRFFKNRYITSLHLGECNRFMKTIKCSVCGKEFTL